VILDQVFLIQAMYLTATQTRQLSKVLDVLTQPGDSAGVRQRLVEPVAQLLNADYVASLVWDNEAQRFGNGVCCHADAGHLRDYEAQYQFSDPIAKLLHPRRYPTLVTQVIAQNELIKSEFFDRFLSTGSMYWGVNVYAHDGRRDVGDLRIWRSRSKHNFDTNELEILRTIYPCLVNALAGAEVERSGKRKPQKTKGLSPSAKPSHRAQQLSYQHGLSQREVQVAQLVALGCADKEIAKQVGIAHTTVRTYLHNALAKTACGNRKELIAYMCSL
jgi:DNA-binding CsgD family transcriptional regulator